MTKLRVAVIESPNAFDVFDERSEGEALVTSCKSIGHQASMFFVKSRREFVEVCAYLAASDPIHANRNPLGPLVLHISSHGNSKGIELGPDFVKWSELVKDVEPIFHNKNYKGSVALSLSSCGSGSHNLHEYLVTAASTDSPTLRLPHYIFSIQALEVHWDQALLGWLLLYHKLSRISFDKQTDVQHALNDVKSGIGLTFYYHRWDSKTSKYRTHKGKKAVR